jgi:hypothetical protein
MRYRYAARPLPMLLGVLFFGACLAFYTHRGLSNHRGLVINRLIELGPDGATVFYWSLAGGSAAFVLVGLWALASRTLRESFLILDEQGLTIPSRWTARTRVIPYSSIRGIELVTLSGQRLLQIETESGKVSVAGIMLESDEQLREVGTELTRRVKQ